MTASKEKIAELKSLSVSYRYTRPMGKPEQMSFWNTSPSEECLV